MPIYESPLFQWLPMLNNNYSVSKAWLLCLSVAQSISMVKVLANGICVYTWVLLGHTFFMWSTLMRCYIIINLFPATLATFPFST